MRKILLAPFAFAAFILVLLLVPSLLEQARGSKPTASSAATACAWYAPTVDLLSERYRSVREVWLVRRSQVRADKPGSQLVQVLTPSGSYWINPRGADGDGRIFIGYLQAEHDWLAALNPEQQVQRGDVVIDCGAHVGVFTNFALQQGAEKVIAIEPEPLNVECLRRKFKREITEGRVVIVPKAVWSEETELEFSLSTVSSGMNSAVAHTGTQRVKVPATKIDTLAVELNLTRIDYIKMDIEGAERHALKGGEATIRRYGPRLMLEMYHLPDDPEVLPKLVNSLRPTYTPVPGPCHRDGSGALVPYVTYFE